MKSLIDLKREQALLNAKLNRRAARVAKLRVEMRELSGRLFDVRNKIWAKGDRK